MIAFSFSESNTAAIITSNYGVLSGMESFPT